MRIKIFALTALTVVLTLRIASRVAIAFSIAEPHSSALKLMKLAVAPPYEIASPHQGLWEDAKSKLFPTVYAQACFAGGCAKPGFKPGAVCNPGCSAGCNCPDCALGPCTIFKCKPAVTSGGCTAGTNPDAICKFSCPDDQSC